METIHCTSQVHSKTDDKIENYVFINVLENWYCIQRNKQHHDGCCHSKRNTTLFRPHCIKDSMYKVMIGRSMEEWKYRQQVSSRKKGLTIRINLDVVLTFWQTWKEDDQLVLKSGSILDSPQIITIRSIEYDVSGEFNSTFSTHISPVLNERQQNMEWNEGDMIHTKKWL
jgi:hypothetical protein